MPLTGAISEGRSFFCPQLGSPLCCDVFATFHQRPMSPSVWYADKSWPNGIQPRRLPSGSYIDLKITNRPFAI
jgi:hypothetical protein